LHFTISTDLTTHHQFFNLASSYLTVLKKPVKSRVFACFENPDLVWQPVRTHAPVALCALSFDTTVLASACCHAGWAHVLGQKAASLQGFSKLSGS
jgi:hypothetical protein